MSSVTHLFIKHHPQPMDQSEAQLLKSTGCDNMVAFCHREQFAYPGELDAAKAKLEWLRQKHQAWWADCCEELNSESEEEEKAFLNYKRAKDQKDLQVIAAMTDRVWHDAAEAVAASDVAYLEDPTDPDMVREWQQGKLRALQVYEHFEQLAADVSANLTEETEAAAGPEGFELIEKTGL
ncbi:hypothetical protein BT63DRAFT_152529 [Microthyrium microscopicum]|uniref:Uncharacterized protein n=1 Tax=Microthyrium microscopicum TaxID=703497 RepID=A0A6A6UPD2_9PEZI|nr:hypothetical protein BT63DRAFT_152529 [Microthyrium microscopicum]